WTRCLLVSDTDEAALLSNLRPWLSGPASKRSRRDASYPSAYGSFSASSRNFRGWLGKRPITFATSPQSVQQNRQLASHRHHGSLFAALASTGGQLQSPASQLRIRCERSQYVLGRLHQQTPQIVIAGFADTMLRIRSARLRLPRA